ncbi:MAG TPA: hypothetical protein VFS57_04655 [Gemmatimonadaceae bacterium]|nr:hypothetical protein [Gemmatimonadaceae bacterium]
MSKTGVRLPQWWNDRIEASWRRSREAAISDWNVRGDRSSSNNAAILEHALAFGHGARSAYPHLVTWDAVAPHLRADWIALGNVGPASWNLVDHLIRHEWLRAAGPGGDATPQDT